MHLYVFTSLKVFQEKSFQFFVSGCCTRQLKRLPDHVAGDEECIAAAVGDEPRIRPPPPHAIEALPVLWREAVLPVATENMIYQMFSPEIKVN